MRKLRSSRLLVTKLAQVGESLQVHAEVSPETAQLDDFRKSPGDLRPSHLRYCQAAARKHRAENRAHGCAVT